MADQYALNFDTSGTNPWLGVWKLSRCMKKAGWTYKGSGDGTSKDTTGTATNDLWGGNADPLLDTAPAWTTAGWWCCEGAPVLKIPITSAPTGNFLRGENVKQATTNAEGEILGVVIDAAGTTGYLVILPRVNGSGTGKKGWQTSYVITGDSSGATVTHNGTAVLYVHQIVFWKGAATNLTGSIYCQCVDETGESANLFSGLMGSATVAIAPGGGGAGNTFPTIAYAAFGTGGSAAHHSWTRMNATTGYGRAQMAAVNATAGSGVSADGTFWIVFANPNLNSGTYGFFGFMRVDDGEDGDIDPWVFMVPNATSIYTSTRTAMVTDAAAIEDAYAMANWHTYGMLRGWRRRGMASADTFVEYEAMFKGRYNTTSKIAINQADREYVACDLQPRYVGQPIFVENTNTSQKQTKGTFRWLRVMSGGSSCDTYLNKKWLQLSHQNGAFIIGPYDGSTVPIFN